MIDIPIGDRSVILSGAIEATDAQMGALIAAVARQAPFRHQITPGGKKMSVAMTSCGDYGWCTGPQGYHYARRDPRTGRPWPPMPDLWRDMADRFSRRAGFGPFYPDSCLINRYSRQASMSLHQDRDEASFDWPIVSLSLGLSARFAFGGFERAEKPQRYDLHSGDVVVWGGTDRLRFHGIERTSGPADPTFRAFRYNLTFRRAGD